MSDQLPQPPNLSRTWAAVLGQLEVELNGPVFETWVRGTRLISYDEREGIATVEAANSFACTNLQERFPLVILRALQARLPDVRDVSFIEPLRQASATPAVRIDHGMLAPQRGRLVGAVNCGFTLERYVAATGNQLARSSCLALLASTAPRVSPVVIFGEPGLGKSHLIHALCHEAVRLGRSVACLSAEQFANHYIGAMKRDNIEEFHRTVRSVDLFILDDLQYLTGKKATANELVHTIDAVTTAGGSVVMASECNPKELPLPERLISRLGAGTITRITPLDRDARLQFIAQAISASGISLPVWATERIAGLDGLSVRTLQGIVHNATLLVRHERLDLASLDQSIMENALVGALPPERSAREIIDEVAAHFATTFDELCSRSRHRHTADARAVVAFVLKKRGMAQGAIAELLGKRDRSTVRDMLPRGEQLVMNDDSLRARYVA